MPALWTYTVDGYNVNDGTNWWTVSMPELDDLQPADHVLVDVQDDFPEYVRSQPKAGRFSMNLEMNAGTEALFRSRLDALDPFCTPGLHTIVAKARGMPSTKTLQALYNGRAVNYKERRVSIEWLAPNPNFV